MWQGLLQVFKALIHLLEARNILVGWLMLPHPPGFPSDPMERKFLGLLGWRKAPEKCLVAVPGVTPSLGAQLGLRDVGQSSEPGEQPEPQDFTAELWMEH